MTIKNSIKKLIYSQSPNEDRRGREFILQILLSLSIVCFSALNVIRLVDIVIYHNPNGLPLIYTLLILGFFIFLFWLSKKGFSRTAAVLLIITYSLPMFYSFIAWGADLPAALLLAVLVITLSGVLLGANPALISTAVIISFSLILTYLQSNDLVAASTYWRAEKNVMGDAIAYAFLFAIIAAVAWLFAREISKALSRARRSEKELKLERDSLEVKVAEKTKQIRQIEAEKINQLYRLAEFGRLSSGIFHDLLNPLTAVSLNLEQIKTEGENRILSAKSFLGQALAAARKMEDLIGSIKKQIARENNLALFSLNEEIRQTIQILNYKARQAKVGLIFKANSEIKFHGDPVKFGQITTNLIANAIEASENAQKEKEVVIELKKLNSQIILSVTDRGQGIAPSNLPKIFEPFFSTKKENGRGLGLGLSSTKNIVEKDFGGVITAQSGLNQGSKFEVIFTAKND